MPDRTKKEFVRIKEDLDYIIKTRQALEQYSPLIPTPFNGKTWEEERTQWFKRNKDALSELLESDKLQSCEMRMLCRRYIDENENRRVQADRFYYADVYIRIASIDELVKGYEFSPLGLKEALVNAISGEILQKDLEKLETMLDSFDNCNASPRAYLFIESKPDSLAVEVALPNRKETIISRFL